MSMGVPAKRTQNAQGMSLRSPDIRPCAYPSTGYRELLEQAGRRSVPGVGWPAIHKDEVIE